MRYSFFFITLVILITWGCKSSQQITPVNEIVIELDGTQSMCITGKGPGQDGAINPYMDRNSKAIVTNMGSTTFDARVQRQSGKVEIIPLKKSEQKEIILLAGEILYFDSEGSASAKVGFAPYPS